MRPPRPATLVCATVLPLPAAVSLNGRLGLDVRGNDGKEERA